MYGCSGMNGCCCIQIARCCIRFLTGHTFGMHVIILMIVDVNMCGICPPIMRLLFYVRADKASSRQYQSPASCELALTKAHDHSAHRRSKQLKSHRRACTCKTDVRFYEHVESNEQYVEDTIVKQLLYYTAIRFQDFKHYFDILQYNLLLRFWRFLRPTAYCRPCDRRST